MGRNVLSDPATGDTYTWPVNHKEEERAGRSRRIESHKPAHSGQVIEPTVSQGEATPKEWKLRGRAFTDEQHRIFLHYRRLSMKRSVYFTHGGEGETFEVFITSYDPKRIAVVRGPRGGLHVWDYDMTLEIIRKVS